MSSSINATNLVNEAGEYVWAKDARKLRIWYAALWISIVVAIASTVVPDQNTSAILSVGFWSAFVTMIGCVVYSYRVQKTLKRLGYARTGAPAIAALAVLALLPTALLAPPAVLSNARNAERAAAGGG